MAILDGYAPGIPCWVDLMARDPAAAATFYTDLFGWECKAGGTDVGGYIMADLDGARVAGIGSLPEDMDIPPAWNSYISTGDIEEALSRAAGAGCAVLVPAMEIVDDGIRHGRMAQIADPSGAVLGIWEADQHHGAQRVNEPGSLTWNELLSRDVTSSRTALAAIFDWNYQQIGDGESFDYTVIHVEGGNPEGVGGIMPFPTEMPDSIPGFWGIYFNVADADAIAAAVVAGGGQLLQGPGDTPMGRMAMFADPQGAVFSVMAPGPS